MIVIHKSWDFFLGPFFAAATLSEAKREKLFAIIGIIKVFISYTFK